MITTGENRNNIILLEGQQKNPIVVENNNDERLIKNMLGVEDRYMLSRLNSSIKEETSFFEKYEINEIPWVVERLFLDLSRTYIQLIRDKLSDNEGKDVVLYILYNCINT